jgi:hypothetical protein
MGLKRKTAIRILVAAVIIIILGVVGSVALDFAKLF